MIKLGVNSVLFKHYSFYDACRAVKACGYDGIEVSAIKGMCEHLDIENYDKEKFLSILAETGLEILSMELASVDEERIELALKVAADLGIPVVNVGSGGESNNEETLVEAIAHLNRMSAVAEKYGVKLCCKAHVGSAIYNTETTLRGMAEITSPNFGVDMDPSHIWRAGEKPEEALASVISRMSHIHIRDCKGPGPSPGAPLDQICGTGDINLIGYFQAMVDANYDGPVCLEVIGPDLDLAESCTVASGSYGYMNACLRQLGAR
ncbi:MAG: sugar phosphate isomerase/epimerase family protein [Carnobacterium sp.]